MTDRHCKCGRPHTWEVTTNKEEYLCENCYRGELHSARVSAALSHQRHHDYYVGLKLAGKLTEDDRPQYELALQRERDGIVRFLEGPQ